MEAMKLIYLTLLVTFVPTKVINICTDESKVQDASNSVLIKADVKQNCTCEIHVANQSHDVTVNIQKYDQRPSSSPSRYGCGLILEFQMRYNFWEAQCVVENSNISIKIQINDVMIIQSISVDGNLEPNEGYCIEILKVDNDSTGNKLQLTCGINSKTENTTTTTRRKTTRSKATRTSTDMTTPMMKKFTNRVLTTTFETDELTLVTSTDISFSTSQTSQQQKDPGTNDITLYVAISATVGGVVTVISITIVVLYYIRFRMLSQCKNSTCSGGANTIYDTLSLPSSANVIDNTGISNNYSLLNINDYQSPIDNKGEGETYIIPMATISTVQGNKKVVTETDRHSNMRRSEYAKLVF